jgi:SOS-response transcriptional repressor LexA
MEELTRKQQAVYNYICDHICEHHRPPTRHEISVAMNFASPNSANEYVAILVRKGYITLLDGDRNLKLKSRRLRIDNQKESVMQVLTEMFKADTAVGCGFYNCKNWIKAYAMLQKISGYKGETWVFDPLTDDFNSLPDTYK